MDNEPKEEEIDRVVAARHMDGHKAILYPPFTLGARKEGASGAGQF